MTIKNCDDKVTFVFASDEFGWVGEGSDVPSKIMHLGGRAARLNFQRVKGTQFEKKGSQQH